MSIFKLALKNVGANKKRSASLMFFILLVTVVSIICINCLYSIQFKMEKSIYTGLTGDVIIRDKESSDNDIYSTNIDALKDKSISKDNAKDIENALADNYDTSEYTARIRYNGMIAANEKSETAMIIGMNPDYTAYQDTFTLTDGDYLDESDSHGVVLVSALAESLNVSTGDTITIYSQSENEEYQSLELKVVGIGDFEGIAIFSLPIMYTNLEDAKVISGYNEGEYTDFIVKSDKSLKASSVASQLDSADVNNNKVAVKNGKDVSGFIILYMNLFSMIFLSLIAVLTCIVGIMVINLVVMMGMQNTVEIGTLKAIGFGRFRITMIYFIEMMATSILSIVIGLIISIIIVGNIHLDNITGTMSGLLGSSFRLNFSIGYSMLSIGVIFVILLLFTIIPCWKITKLNPVEAFREGY